MYKIKGVVDSSQVPDWERRPAKWDDLVNEVLKLNPGQSLVVHFDNQKEAERARNAVRERVNFMLNSINLRTRMIINQKGGFDVFLIRVFPPRQEDAGDE